MLDGYFERSGDTEIKLVVRLFEEIFYWLRKPSIVVYEPQKDVRVEKRAPHS